MSLARRIFKGLSLVLTNCVKNSVIDSSVKIKFNVCNAVFVDKSNVDNDEQFNKFNVAKAVHPVTLKSLIEELFKADKSIVDNNVLSEKS